MMTTLQIEPWQCFMILPLLQIAAWVILCFSQIGKAE
jgi:hypothetical protein